MDKKLDKILKQFVQKSIDFIDADEIFLYGSYAKGSENNESDIDVAVILDDFDGDYLQTSAELFNIVSEIDVRLEPVLLVKTHDKPGFIEHIKSYGKRLYLR